jgi:hypothetical protein
MTKISSLLKAAAIGLPLLGGTPAEAIISTPSSPSVNDKQGRSVAVPPQPTAPLSGSCKMRILSYFSEENLRDIDSALHGIGAWFTRRNMKAPQFEAYEEGGVNYLARDPGNVIAAIDIYKTHVDTLREKNPAEAASFDAEHGAKLVWLEKVSINAMMGIAQQVDTGCRAPSQTPVPSF